MKRTLKLWLVLSTASLEMTQIASQVEAAAANCHVQTLKNVRKILSPEPQWGAEGGGLNREFCCRYAAELKQPEPKIKVWKSLRAPESEMHECTSLL